MDWLVATAVVVFALRGIREGLIRQAFGLIGWFGGIWSFMVVSQWVGAHWLGARPAVVFGVLRWLVALLAGLAVGALFSWWGDRIGEAGQKTVGGFLDRAGGLLLGAGLGVAVVTAALVGLLLLPWPRDAGRAASQARTTGPLLEGARRLLNVDDRFLPGLGGVRQVLSRASLRARVLSRHS